jgi:hypothetical protein
MSTNLTDDHGALGLLRRRSYDRKGWLRRLAGGRPPAPRRSGRATVRSLVAAPGLAG